MATYNCSYDQSVGITTQQDEFSIFPNPASDYITVFSRNISSEFEVIIVDVSGKIVLRKTTQNNASLDVSSLANGYYFIGSYSNNNRLIPFVKD